MQEYSVSIEGTRALLQHKFGVQAQATAAATVKKQSGQIDFSEEWRTTCYLLNNEIVQPAEHIWRSMVKAAVSFKIKGKRGKTYKDLVTSAVYIEPDLILYGLELPEGIDDDPSKPVYIDIRPVRIQRARVLRQRLAIRKGWRLNFTLQCLDDQLQKEVIKAILDEAGQCVGIGDYRPRFGLYMVTQFDEAV